MSCCNDHDICYETFNKTKDFCDKVFKDCAVNTCNNGWGCKLVAELFNAIVGVLGCPSYMEKQKRASLCI